MQNQALFEQTVVPHLDAAFNLARWLTRSDQDAQDVVQEAMIRAMRFFAGCSGQNPRGWLLTIVRNCAYSWLKSYRQQELELPLDLPDNAGPERVVLEQLDLRQLARSLEELPVEYREVVVLRELEGMSYKAIADIAGVPIGTVMSRLNRARLKLKQQLKGVMA